MFQTSLVHVFGILILQCPPPFTVMIAITLQIIESKIIVPIRQPIYYKNTVIK